MLNFNNNNYKYLLAKVLQTGLKKNIKFTLN